MAPKPAKQTQQLPDTSLLRQLRDLAMGEHPMARYAPPALLVFEALVLSGIISYVDYTEIDWKAYMEQVAQIANGEYDYTKIKGGTGPLVYPALHVYIYRVLYYLTDKGANILLAQRLFGVLYLGTLTMVMLCYRKARAPLYIFPMLVLSKRLHSIFVLRLFNDCFAIFFFWAAVLVMQDRKWSLGSLIFSLGLGVKMSLLLSLPAFGVIIFLAEGLQVSLWDILMIGQIQIFLGIPFMAKNILGYLGRSFELTREFLYKWTVNWRFVGEEIFLSKEFAITLLVGHISVLLLFITTRWLRPAEKPISELIARALKFEEPLGNMQHATSIRLSPNFILTTVMTANAIGMLFARSLHYQFYAYIAWATPFLLWRSGLHPVVQYAVWGAQEWAWNVYPSTDASSLVAVGSLATIVLSVWWGTRKDFVHRHGGAVSVKKAQAK